MSPSSLTVIHCLRRGRPKFFLKTDALRRSRLGRRPKILKKPLPLNVIVTVLILTWEIRILGRHPVLQRPGMK